MKNNLSNLELLSYSGQRFHAIRELGARHWDCRGSRNPKTRLTEADVLVIRERRKAGEMAKNIAADYGLDPRVVSQICTRRTWQHV